ncbi:MAG: hypothetical protein WBC22_09025 [Sedimentisphaerales bacterium]
MARLLAHCTAMGFLSPVLGGFFYAISPPVIPSAVEGSIKSNAGRPGLFWRDTLHERQETSDERQKFFPFSFLLWYSLCI